MTPLRMLYRVCPAVNLSYFRAHQIRSRDTFSPKNNCLLLTKKKSFCLYWWNVFTWLWYEWFIYMCIYSRNLFLSKVYASNCGASNCGVEFRNLLCFVDHCFSLCLFFTFFFAIAFSFFDVLAANYTFDIPLLSTNLFYITGFKSGIC